MSRETAMSYERVELNGIEDPIGSGDYTPVTVSAGNKFRIRFPTGSVYIAPELADGCHLTITLKIEG